MKIQRTLPPNYAEIAEALSPTERTVFTYGDTVYAPSLPEDVELPPDLLIHEETHEKQQTNPKAWWDRYLIDPEFRLQEELAAYRAQYSYIESLNVKRAGKDAFLDQLAYDLSSPAYGNILTFGEARSKIRSI